MTILDFLNELRDQIPNYDNTGTDFREKAKCAKDRFFAVFDKVDEDDLKRFLQQWPIESNLTKRKLKHRFTLIYKSLQTTIDAYYAGQPAVAFKEVSKLLSNVSYMRSLSDSYHGFLDIKDFRMFKHLSFYRMRANSNYNLTKQAEMFHVPFEKRGIVSTARFSIPGFPCLYLNSSIKGCWNELGQKKDEIYASRFEFNASQDVIRPLNLSNPARFTAKIYDDTNELNESYEALSFLLTFPVIQFCLFKVPDENVNHQFKPEYILPQLLMQYIHNNKIDSFFNSIVYTSTRHKSDENHLNLVVPVKVITPSGYCCRLKQNFKLTTPIKITGFTDVDFKAIQAWLEHETANILS